MDLGDPAPLVMTAENLSPILSHLSQPQFNKSPNQTNLPLDLPLMKSTLNLLAQVQLEDERMDREERLEGAERETKRSRYFAWVGLFRTTASRDLEEEVYVYARCLLLRVTTLSSSSRPRSKDMQRAREEDFRQGVIELFLPPSQSTSRSNARPLANGTGLTGRKGGVVDIDMDVDVNAHAHASTTDINGDPTLDDNADFFKRQTTTEEWEWYRVQYETSMRLYEGWLNTGKLDRKSLPRSTTFGRIGERLQKYVEEVLNRADKLHAAKEDTLEVLSNKAQPDQPQNRLSSRSDGRAVDQEKVREGAAMSSDKEKQRADHMPVVASHEGQDARSLPATGRPMNRPSSGPARRPANVPVIKETDADRLKRVRQSLNGGRDLQDKVDRIRKVQVEEVLMDEEPFKQERASSIADPGQEARRTTRTRFSGQGELEEAQKTDPRSELSFAARGRHTFDQELDEREYEPYHQARPPHPYPSSARPPRSSLPARHLDRQRERSVSVFVPDLPPGTILRVNERGVAEVMMADHPVDQMHGNGTIRDNGYEYDDQDQYAERESGMDVDVTAENMDWRGASFLDEGLDADIDPDLDVDDRLSTMSRGGEYRENSGPVSGPGLQPAGYRWALIPDEPEFPRPRSDRRGSYAPSTSRIVYPGDLQRSPVLPAYHNARSISMQERRFAPNSGFPPRYQQAGQSERRSSVQPSFAAARTRYMTPIPHDSRAQSVLGRDPRRRHTDFVRPVARSPLALSSIQAEARQGIARRRQGYSLGGAESRFSGVRRESVARQDVEPVQQPMADWIDNSFEHDESPFHPPPTTVVHHPRSEQSVRPQSERQASQPVIKRAAAHDAPISSRSALVANAAAKPDSPPNIGNSQVPSTNAQTNQDGSSPFRQPFRPFDQHKVLRNPQRAKRASLNTGLHTGRPEFQLAGANETKQTEPNTQQGEQEVEEAPTATTSVRSARQRERDAIVAQKEKSRRRASKIFRTSDDDDD